MENSGGEGSGLSESQIEQMPIMQKLQLKLNKQNLPMTMRDIKYGAENMIPEGQYKQLNSMLNNI